MSSFLLVYCNVVLAPCTKSIRKYELPRFVIPDDVLALDAANSAPLGVWLDGETTALDVMDQFANSVGAWWGFDTSGQLRMAQMTLPTGDPILEVTITNILNLELTVVSVGENRV